MALLKKYWIVIILLPFLQSCVTLKRCNERYPPIIKDSVSTQYVETVHDSVIYLKDEASLQALLECDSLGNVRMRQIQSFVAGQFVKPSIIIKDNYITAKCTIDSAGVYIHWKDTHIKESKVQVRSYPVEVKLGWWKSAALVGGYVFFFLIVLAIVYVALKVFKVVKLPF
jgi:hypothetical protein